MLVGENALLYGIQDSRNHFNNIQTKKLAEYNEAIAGLRAQSVARLARPAGGEQAPTLRTGDADAKGSRYVTPPERPTVRDHDNIKAGYSTYVPGTLKFDFDEKGQRFPVEINSRGFRGAITERKAPGTIRVATIGASSTFGYRNRDETTYPFLMERMLNERCRRTVRYEVINLGVPHLTAEEMYFLLVNEALPLDPDVVTFYEGANDMDIQRSAHIAPFVPSFLYRKLLTVNFAINTIANQFSLFDEHEIGKFIHARGSEFLKWVSAMRDAVAGDRRIFVVANQQLKSLLINESEIRGISYQDEYRVVTNILAKSGDVHHRGASFLAHYEVMRRLERWASEAGVPFVDAIAAMNKRRDTLISPVHLSAEGNAILASAFAEMILQLTCQDGSVSQDLER